MLDHRARLAKALADEEERQARMDDPEYRKLASADRTEAAQGSNQNAFAAALAKSAAQIGTLGGKTADSSAVDDLAQGLDKSSRNYYADLAGQEQQTDLRRERSMKAKQLLAERQSQLEAAGASAAAAAEEKGYRRKRDAEALADRQAGRADAMAERRLRREEMGEHRDRTYGLKTDEKLDRDTHQHSEVLARSGIPSAVTQLERVHELLPEKGDAPGYGRVAGALPDFMVSQEGEDLRQGVQTLFNIELKDRSGAAVTDQELARLRKEFGQGTWKSEDQLRTGIAQYEARLKEVIRNINAGADPNAISEYSRRGGRNFGEFKGRGFPKKDEGAEGGTAIAAPDQKALDDMTDAELEAYISSGGGSK